MIPIYAPVLAQKTGESVIMNQQADFLVCFRESTTSRIRRHSIGQFSSNRDREEYVDDKASYELLI